YKKLLIMVFFLSIENNKGIADSYPFVHYDGSAEIRTLEPFRVVGFQDRSNNFKSSHIENRVKS
ncbi:TPA: hypothetical protein ACIVGV_004363, partial [Salmonella enterica subsp. houtenae serovar Houten]